jgi:hypothetical protein
MFSSIFFAAVTHATLLVFAFSLGGLVRLHNPKSITNQIFFWFALSIVFWDVTNFCSLLFARPPYLNLDHALLSTRFIMVSGSLITVFMALFVYVFPKEEAPFSPKQAVFLSIGSMVYVISGFFVWIGFDMVKPVSLGSMLPATIPSLPTMPIWGFITIAATFVSVGYLIKKYRGFEAEDRKRYLSTVIGLSCVALLPVLLFLPVAIWNDSRINFIGPLVYIPIIYGIGYGVVRHHIFNVKLLYAEVCILAMAFILFVNIWIP